RSGEFAASRREIPVRRRELDRASAFPDALSADSRSEPWSARPILVDIERARCGAHDERMVNPATMLRLSTVDSPGHGAGLAAGATARWEWRIFERCPASFIERVVPRGSGGQPSRETYLLSSVSRHN